MPVSLTNLPLPWVAEPSLVDYGGDQAPPMGGAPGRFVRVGSRWAVKFSKLPALGWTCAQALIAARLAASAAGSTVITSWPQIAFPTAIGAPVVSGAGQAGNTLAVRGLTAGSTAIVAGLFFSVTVAGRNYLYMTADAATVDGAGNATLSIAPRLRAAPADGAAPQFATPQVEGFIDGSSVDWTLNMLAWVGVPAFTITEVA